MPFRFLQPYRRRTFFAYFFAFAHATCTFISLQGQQAEKISFQNITINDGLSQGMVNQILQDRFGFMWFATKDGLNKYDGYNFKNYRHDTEDTSSLAESFVQSLFEDSYGRIWAGTSSGNLDYFDHPTETFKHIISENSKQADLADAPVSQVMEDRQGNICVLYFNKLVIIKIENKGKATFRYSFEKVLLPASIKNPFLFISNSGTVYLYSRTSPNYYILQSTTHQWERKSFADDQLRNRANNILSFLEDSITNKIYAACLDGIYNIGQNGNRIKLVDHSMSEYTQLFLDKEKNIWFTDINRLGLFNTKNKTLNFLTATDETNQSRIGLFNSSCVDRSGLIWIGTKGYGLLTLDYEAHKFHHTDNTSVYSIIETDDGRVVVNSGYGLGKVLDLSTHNYTDTIPVANAKVYFDNFDEFTFPSATDNKDRRWFAGDQRLVSFNTATKRSAYYLFPVKRSAGSYSVVSDIKADKQGKVWVGTSDGLYVFDPEKNHWGFYSNDPKDKNSLSFNSIFSLCFDPIEPAKYLWIGTNGGGLNRMDLTTGKCIRYSVKNGLPNDVVYGILPDNANNLWMSTNKGLSCFDAIKQTFKNFEEKDGLQSNEFNHNAYLRTKNGILFFGGVNGYNYFDPSEIVSNPIAPKVVITDLRIRNKTVDVKQEGSPLENAVYLTKSITLPYSDNMITFEFAALDFIAPEKNQYQYKLDGFDNDWVNSGNTHVATYTNLDPGTYTFRVKGSNKDDVWNETGTSIELIIKPPWYKTWLFRLLVVAVIALTIYFFYRYRLNQALKVHAMRNSIAKDLHDEIGSNLSNISIFSEVAQQRKGTADETEPLLQKISEYSHVSMTAMSDIVWMINARNDAFENIISRMRSLAAEVFEAKNYALHLHFDEQLNQLTLNMEQRKNFYLIYKEAINNIAKYANCENVWITLKKENNTIILIVKDDGIGFNKDEQTQGNGLYNMQKRAEVLNGKLMIDSDVSKGTTVQLIFIC